MTVTVSTCTVHSEYSYFSFGLLKQLSTTSTGHVMKSYFFFLIFLIPFETLECFLYSSEKLLSRAIFTQHKHTNQTNAK